jgi:hypothetical protein
MKVGDNYQASISGHAVLNLSRWDTKAIFESTFEPLHVSSKIAGQRQ